MTTYDAIITGNSAKNVKVVGGFQSDRVSNEPYKNQIDALCDFIVTNIHSSKIQMFAFSSLCCL